MIETTHILNEYILPNPWQPRDGEDPEHIRSLADSIASQGLMQFAMGRWVDQGGKLATGLVELAAAEDILAAGFRVQLAFGHSRLAAFKYLDEAGIEGFGQFPVMIRDLEDEELIDRLTDENRRRKGLNPIEEARLMETYRGRFGRTSAEIGLRFGYSDSAVRNILRLLKLPESVQNMLRFNEISQGAGRALVALFDIPEVLRLEAEDGDDLKPSEIVEAARSGISPDKISEMVLRLAGRINPQAAQIALPAPLPVLAAPEAEEETDPESPAALSTETLAEEMGEEEIDSPAPAMIPGPELEPTLAPVPQAPRPQPIPAAVPAPVQPAAKPQPARVSVPAPAPVVQPAAVPVPEPPAIVPWEKSTILLSMTLWPEDGATGGRIVSMGARANQGIPLMAHARMDNLVLPGPLQEMVSKLHQRALDEIQPVRVEG